jgi:hypothetical protein
MLLGHIRPVWFFAALAVGLLYTYLVAPAPEVVVKFPSPYNAGQVVYKDKAETCYRYSASRVSCPRDKGLIKEQPIAEDFRAGKQHPQQQGQQGQPPRPPEIVSV